MDSRLFERLVEMGHEQLLLCHDASAGFRGLIAIHSTKLGPALGGTRFWAYENEAQAIMDVLRLSRGMTYKCAMAGIPFGGGKTVILADNQTTGREKIFRALGRFIERLGGRYITAEDVGTSPADMEYIRLETAHVAGLTGRSGDPSPWTALGVFRALQAAAKHRWSTDNLSGKTVALQGCGNVGYHLAKALHRAGAMLIVADIHSDRVKRAVSEFGAKAVQPEAIYGVQADIFAPCALGGILNDRVIPQLNVEIVAGAANNQLLEARHGDMLMERGITYVPDYVANAGGVINGCRELLDWESTRALKQIHEIYDTTFSTLETANAQHMSTHRAADRIAERRLKSGLGA